MQGQVEFLFFNDFILVSKKKKLRVKARKIAQERSCQKNEHIPKTK